MQPDELADRVRPALTGTRFGDLRWVDRTGSTNADLLVAAQAGAPEGTVLLAEEQTARRGRLGRTWSAPPGSSLLCSILLRPPLAPADAHLATAAVALAARHALAEVADVAAGLKWPNDLVVEGDGGTRKLAGVLAQAVLDGDRLDALVVGIGVNVNWPARLPDELAEIATAADRVAGHEVDRTALLGALLVRLDAELADLATGEGRAALAGRYGAACVTVGQDVRVELTDEHLVGRAVGVSPSGHLVVEVTGDDGDVDRREVAVGDVVHLRPHP